YASTGVVLSTVDFDGKTVKANIAGTPGVGDGTEIIGTKKGFNATSTAAVDEAGYVIPRSSTLSSRPIAAVYFDCTDLNRGYMLTGEELSVRARAVSDKIQDNPHETGDVEMAWTQPVVLK